MKRILLVAALAIVAGTAFAQEALVREALKLSEKGDYEQAVSTITPALTSLETKNKAGAWNTLSGIHYDYYIKNYTISEDNKAKGESNPYDESGMYKAFVASYEAAIVCDSIESQPNEKGKVNIKFRETNANKFLMTRVMLIAAGQYEYSNNNTEEAIKRWRLYVDGENCSLFTGKDMTNDPYSPDICYYIGFASYSIKDYSTAITYAKKAAEDPEKAKDANEVVLFSLKDRAKTKADSLEYLGALKDFHATYPDEERYFNLLMEYYSQPGRNEELNEWIEEEAKISPNNKVIWALKGENLMNSGKWDDAISAYAKAIEIDPDYVAAVFNSGVCLNSKAIQMKDDLADKNTGGLTEENANKVKAVLAEAKVFMERTRELDPDQTKTRWAYPLYQIYYNLGESEKSAEMEKLLNTDQ